MFGCLSKDEVPTSCVSLRMLPRCIVCRRCVLYPVCELWHLQPYWIWNTTPAHNAARQRARANTGSGNVVFVQATEHGGGENYILN